MKILFINICRAWSLVAVTQKNFRTFVSNISVKSKPYSKILLDTNKRPTWVKIMKKYGWKISWQCPFNYTAFPNGVYKYQSFATWSVLKGVCQEIFCNWKRFVLIQYLFLMETVLFQLPPDSMIGISNMSSFSKTN